MLLNKLNISLSWREVELMMKRLGSRPSKRKKTKKFVRGKSKRRRSNKLSRLQLELNAKKQMRRKEKLVMLASQLRSVSQMQLKLVRLKKKLRLPNVARPSKRQR